MFGTGEGQSYTKCSGLFFFFFSNNANLKIALFSDTNSTFHLFIIRIK